MAATCRYVQGIGRNAQSISRSQTGAYRAIPAASKLSIARSYSAYSTETSSVPRIASPSIWTSLIPKAFRKGESAPATASTKKKKKKIPFWSREWNPATVFIILALLIGSNAIQMIALRNNTLNYSRKADAKIALLKEVIRKLRQGEEVDVEGMLGTGIPEHEKEWDEVVKELEANDGLWEAKKQRRVERKARKEEAVAAEAAQGSNGVAPTRPEEVQASQPKWY